MSMYMQMSSVPACSEYPGSGSASKFIFKLSFSVIKEVTNNYTEHSSS